MSERYNQLNSNLICILCITVLRTLLISVSVECIVFITRTHKIILILYGLLSQIVICASGLTVDFIELKFGTCIML